LNKLVPGKLPANNRLFLEPNLGLFFLPLLTFLFLLTMRSLFTVGVFGGCTLKNADNPEPHEPLQTVPAWVTSFNKAVK